jgi:glycosyltransferase involved in cell wall biosynthesis
MKEDTRIEHLRDFPNVTLISQEVPHSKAAGSLLLLRLFECWPKDRLQVIGPLPPGGAVTLNCSYTGFRPRLARLQFTRFAPLLSALAGIIPPQRVQPAVRRPGVVVSVMQTGLYYAAAYAAAKRLGLPLCLIVHDDPEEIEIVAWWGLPLVRRFNRRVYQQAQLCLCVSPQLRDVLAERYGRIGHVLYPNRSPSLQARDPEANIELRRGRLTIGYAGTMVYGYGNRLEELAPIFRAAGVTLRIYSLEEPNFLGAGGVEYAGPYSPDVLWERVKSECDAVILPYCGPRHGHTNLYRTHFPSKLPEYLALGMPVIITGPAYATGMQWAADHPDACLRVPVEEDERWPEVLSQLAVDGVYRGTLARGALKASGEFDPGEITSRFVAYIRSAAEAQRSQTGRKPAPCN